MSLIDNDSGLPLQDSLKLLNQAVSDMRTYKNLGVAAVSCMLYDILLTIEQERSLIWPARWSYGKWLYFIVRYPVAIEEVLYLVYTVDMNAPEPFCRFETYLSTWATLIFLVPLQIVVVLRIIAIWEQKRPIVVLLWFSLIATDIVLLVTLARVTHIFDYSIMDLLHPILGCQSGVVSVDPAMTIPAWAGVMAFDTVLFVLTLVRGLHSYKTAHTPLLSILVRDGLAYYSVMLALAISNLVFFSALPAERIGLTSSLTPVLRCSYPIIGSRIILNIRAAAQPRVQPASDPQDIQLVDVSGTSSDKTRQESRNITLVYEPDNTRISPKNQDEWRLGPSSLTAGGISWHDRSRPEAHV